MFIFNNSFTGILRDTDMSETATPITLCTSQNYAFQYIHKMLRDMEPFSNADIDVDIDDIDRNIVSYLSFKIDLHYIAYIISCPVYLVKFHSNLTINS